MNPTEHRHLALPFVDRTKEIAQLSRLHVQRRHVLVVGPAGVGKSALLAFLRERLPLLLCPRSERLGDICDSLETELQLGTTDRKLVQRKQRVREALTQAGQVVVFDGLGWTTPKLGSYLESVMQRVPVWIGTRSEHPWDIGHCWTMVARFERVEVHPFHLPETQALVEAAVSCGMVPAEALGIVEWLHRRSAGSPLVLRRLLDELATGRYDLSNPLALRRLDLDRRIHEVLAALRNAPVAGEG